MYWVYEVEEPTATLKRHIYLLVYVFALAGSATAFVLNEVLANATPFSRVILVAVSLGHVVMIGALR